ncbi:MAG TPA: hypothetical protein VHA73_15380 [Acidimicrobiales bacterium]|jgi:hypothetical protein|nr:hypothetical protein [Acidimicrobiales bacterium]
MERPDPLDAEAAALQVDAAAHARRVRRGLARQDLDEATLAAMLVDWAERDATVVLELLDGQRRTGRIVAVGADFAELRGADGTTFLRIDAMFAAIGGPEAGRPPGQRTPATSRWTLRDALAALEPDRPRIGVRALGGEPLRGRLLDVGADVLRLQLDGDAGAVAYVALASLAEASVTGSG